MTASGVPAGAGDRLAELLADPAAYGVAARARAREVAERDVARRLRRKQQEARRG